MSTLGELNVLITADSRQYVNELNRVQNQTNRVMGSVRSAIASIGKITALALAARKVYEFGKECIQLGSDLAEVQNVVDTTFTAMSESVNRFSKSAIENFGLSEAVSKKYVGTFGAMAKSFGFAEQEAYNMSTTLTGLAGDVASFYNMTSDEAYTKLKSVFTGETETLKELGVVMTQNALDQYALANGYGMTTSAMSEQEKVALRYNFVLQQLSLANGDFAKTSDSWANQVRVMQLRFESFKATMGQGLINIFLPLIKVINAVIERLQVFAAYFSAITGALFGKAQKGATNTSSAIGTTPKGLGTSLSNTGNSANSASKGLNKAAKATKKAGASANKAKKEIKGLLGGLDEINNLTSNKTGGTNNLGGGSSPSTGGAGGIGGAGVGDLGLGDIPTVDIGSKIDTSGLDDKVEKIKKVFDKLKKYILDRKEAIIAICAGLLAGVGSYFVISKWSTITGAVIKGFSPLTKVVTFVKEVALGIKRFGITPIVKGLLGINPVVVVIATVIGAVVGSITYLWQTNKDFKNNIIKTWKAIKDTLSPWLEGFKELFLLLADIVGTILGGAFKILSKIVVKVVEVLVNNFLKKIQKYCPQVKNLGQAFNLMVKALSKGWKKLKNFNLKKWLDKKVKEVKKSFDDIVKRFEDLKKDVKKKWDDIVKSVKDFVINIASKVEDFKEKAVQSWDDVCDWVKDKFLEVGSKVQDFKDKALESWNSVKEWIKDKILELGSKVASFYEKAKERWDYVVSWIKDKFLELGAKVGSFYEKAKDRFESAKDWIKDKLLELGAKVGSFYEKAKERYDSAKSWVRDKALELGAKVASFYEKAKERYYSAKNSIKNWALSIGAKVGSFYDKVKSAYNSTKSSIKNWAFSIGLKVTSSISSIKSTINGMIDSINRNVIAKLDITMPSWMPGIGGNTWRAPRIPKLARGGMVDSATIAMIGEAGKEVVLPLENNTGALDLIANRLVSRMNFGNSNFVQGFSNNQGQSKGDTYTGDIVINLDGNNIFRSKIVDILRQLKRQGITI